MCRVREIDDRDLLSQTSRAEDISAFCVELWREFHLSGTFKAGTRVLPSNNTIHTSKANVVDGNLALFIFQRMQQKQLNLLDVHMAQ